MDNKWLERTALLIGDEAVITLNNANVLVIGLGGVGSYAAESLIRAGVGRMTIVDGDGVDITNINRQLQALRSTLGQNKAHLLKARFFDINPEAVITAIDHFLEPDDMTQLLGTSSFDYVLDCIDSVQPKIKLLHTCIVSNQRIVSAMGAGGKLDPSKVKIADIAQTRNCKFAQQVRKELKRLGIKDNITTVYSDELQAADSLKHTDGTKFKKSFYGTISYMPALFGMTMASVVIRELGGGRPVGYGILS